MAFGWYSFVGSGNTSNQCYPYAVSMFGKTQKPVAIYVCDRIKAQEDDSNPEAPPSGLRGEANV